MKQRPILFSAPMVNAILEGRKTQTRRVLKLIPDHMKFHPIPHHICEDGGGNWVEWYGPNKNLAFDWDAFTLKAYPNTSGRPCPYGRQGDQLWVRETFANVNEGFPDVRPYFVYAADESYHIPIRWKPSIHMPRTASRIMLEVVNVRAERLQDISESDAIAEGVFYHEGLDGYCTDNEGRNFHHSNPVTSYCKLWCAINGPESWDENPWVFAIEFKHA